MLKPHYALEPLLRRAMAYYRRYCDTDGTHVDFIYQVLGRGTRSLAGLRVGSTVDFLGSLGNSFDEDSLDRSEALLVAGGVGAAGLFLLAESLSQKGVPVRLFLGGASRDDLCGYEDFVDLLGEDNISIATIDGSLGEKGFVTGPLEDHLAKRSTAPHVFACGPDAMLHRVSQITSHYNVPTQLSLESPMACGFGICVGCAVAVKSDCETGFTYKKVCTDGPIFRSDELYW